MDTEINLGTLTAVLVFLIFMLVEHTCARTYIVGDSLGWRIPPKGAAVYTSWASQHSFSVGDVLVFNYPTGQHDVARVTKAAFDACNSTSPVQLDTVGPTNITLASPGEAYFFCTFGQHCLAGQKLAVNVTSAPPSPSPGPAPSPVPTPTPTPSVNPVPSPTPGPNPAPGPSPGPTPAPAPTNQTPSPAPGGNSASPPAPPSPGTPAPGSPPGSLVPPPAGGDSPPPPPNSAPGTGISGMFVIFISAAIGIMF